MGNRTSETKDGVPFTYSYDDHNKLTSLTGGGMSASFGYDGNGSMTSVSGDMFGSWTLAYDDANRPTSIVYPAGVDTYVYNAFGQRTRASLNGTIFRYVYNGSRVLEQTDDAGNLLSRYATAGASYYGPLLEFEFPDGSQRYPLYDMTGTARRLADASGAVTDGYSFDAFGRWLSGWVSTESPYDYGAAWGYLRDYSGMEQLGARFYWPEIGRFIQQDPARDGGNWYAYAGSSPLVYIDPTGLISPGDIGAWIDCHLLFGATGKFGGAAGDWDAGRASGWDVAAAGAEWGAGVAGLAAGSVSAGGALGRGIAGLVGRAGAEAAGAAGADAIGATGRIGEEALQAYGGTSQVPINTSEGLRIVDQLIGDVANESKVGYQCATNRVLSQIAKDAALINDPGSGVNAVIWHFFESPITGRIGPSAPLARALGEAGISIVIH